MPQAGGASHHSSLHSPPGPVVAGIAATPRRVALGYLAFGLIWIWFSDSVLYWVNVPPDLGFWAAAAKGTSFVALSTLLVFVLARREVRNLARLTNLLTAVTEGTADAMFVKDREGRYLLVNSAASRFIGRPVEEILGHDDREFFGEAGAKLLRERGERVMASGEGETEEEVLTAAGVTRTYVAKKAPLRDEQGAIIGLIGISRDVTDQKRAEQAVRVSEQRMRLMLDHAPAALALLDRDMRYLKVSRRWLSSFGLDEKADLTGKSHYDVFPDMPERWLEAHRRAMAGQVLSAEKDRYERADGSVLWLRWEVRPWHDAEGQVAGIVIFSEDITQRQSAEDALRQSETWFRKVFENAAMGIAITDLDGRIQRCNPAMCALLGYTESEFRDRTPAEFIHAEDVDANMDLLWQVARGETPSAVIENRYVHKSGEPVWARKYFSVLPDDSGRPAHLIALVTDISAARRAEAEIRRMNAELEQRVRDRTAELEAANKELEAFSYSVSHDLRAPLRAIDGFSRIVLNEYGGLLPAEGREYLADIRSNTKRMGTLIDDLLGFSRLGREPIVRGRVETRELVERCARELINATPRPIELRIDELPPCEADAGLLQQVWVNLLENAVKYTRGRSPAVIEVGAAVSSGVATYRVRDNGIGFDMRYADRLFGVFQRLHNADDYDGTGIGLALAQRIVHRHGGRIWAEAEPEKGATFYFTLGRPPVDPDEPHGAERAAG